MIRSVPYRHVRLALVSAALAAALVALPAVAHAAITWAAQGPVTDGTMLSSVVFTDASHGWAVGDLGAIVHTSDGGATWNGQDSGLTDGTMLSSVVFTDPSHGWAVGDGGTVIHTTNGGATWSAQDSGISDGSNLYGVTFTDATHGWAVGDAGTVIHTANGGATWNGQDSGIADGSNLYSVVFTDTSNGWAVGDNDTIVSTTDGGATWIAQDSGISDGSTLYSVAFPDASDGWAVGDAGMIVSTTDGGATWTAQDCGVTDGSNLYGVGFVDAGHGWAVGDNGTIVAYGGPAPAPDTTPPTTTLLVTPVPASGWNDSPVTVELDAVDNPGGSGVVATYYTLDNGIEQTYDSPFDVSDEGVHTLAFHSMDASGNVEAAQAATIGIDLTAPSLSLDATSSYAGSATVHASASDAFSGVGHVEMRLDGGPWKSGVTLSTSIPGTHTLDARAFDVAGNEADTSEAFIVTWPQTVGTATKLTVPTSVKVRNVLKMTGSVLPAGAPGTVRIAKTRLIGRKWKSAGSVTVAVVNGSFAYSFKPTVRGSWRFVATYAGGVVGTTTCLSSHSATKTVKVK
jgi:photosystem II stability/assembly factor-like uncharacterized protein